ncbi:transposase (plasmid) [Nostoc sp. C057]|uniref:transposase n=1 Tax=Nostoc sp. C057 TaxID=2576903 RepID=UPI0015C30BA5|nr:transposase [Nostoc sp. C057]QLE53488.1 transposase [Nostoc sp. C057]
MSLNQEYYLNLLEQIRWGGTPRCPYCGSINATAYKSERRYHCNECFTSYSVTVGTLFHKTYVDLEKWFVAIRLVIKSPKSTSARKLAENVGVNKNTACYMIARIRRAMVEELELLEKLMQIDESDK